MKRGTLAALAATGALVAGIAAAAVVGRRSDQDSSGDGVRSTPSPHEISSYWTDERQRQATPG